VKLSDFGMWGARHMASDIRNIRNVAKRTESMSPEVARGRTPDSKSDVFSLGLILHEMLVGPRFSRQTTEPDALRLARDGFIEPVSVGPHLPRDLGNLMLRALAIDPRDRFPSAAAMGFELRRVALNLGVGDLRAVMRSTLESVFQDDISEATRPSFVVRANDTPDDQKDTKRELDRRRKPESGAVVKQLRQPQPQPQQCAAPARAVARVAPPQPILEIFDEDDAEQLDDADIEWGGYTDIDERWPR
jgi:serine/threonine protein kinase